MYMDDFDVFNYECEGQMSITDYTYGLTRNRYGKTYEASEWMVRERCENCKHWEMLPVEEQPPAGWGVKGQCNCTHEPEMMKNGYWITNRTSYCNDFIGK